MNEHLWQRAASFAARVHAHQLRKDSATPYFAHPARVAMTVMYTFDCRDEIAIAAAFLHDTIEDTGTDYDELLGRFGRRVAQCVAALTKNMALSESIREREYDAALARADWRARLVKLADQHDNYIDALAMGSAQARKAAAKCRRAIALARVDSREHPESRRAIAAVGALLRAKPRARRG